jgi:starch-binding outer membrane protein, SusD/RagB family
MKKAFSYFAVLLTIGAISWSCSSAILDKQPIDKLSEDAVWGDVSLVEAYVNSKYQDMTWGFQEVLWSCFTDESMFKHDYGTHAVNRGEVTAANNPGYFESVWVRNYAYIRDANIFFEKIGSVKGDAAQINRMKGEMTFIRAMRYFDLLRSYGGVPLITKSYGLSDDFAAGIERSTIDQTVEFIVKECDAAAALLPASFSGSNVGRATKGACLALKARTLLYAASPLYAGGNDVAKWKKAADANQAVMDLKQYSLNPDYSKTFLDIRNPEIILDEAHIRQSGWLWLERYNGPNGFGGWAGNMPSQTFVDEFEMTNGKMITEAGSGYNPQEPYKNRDPRFDATILYNGSQYKGRAIETFLPGGKDTKDGIEPWNTSLTGYYIRKFMYESASLSNDDNTTGNNHWPFFRYGETLLNYAEAINEAEGPAKAYAAIDMVRARAKMPALAAGLSQAQMREKIIHERMIELSFEEHRFFDVRRWKIAEVVGQRPTRGVDIRKAADGKLTYAYQTIQERKFLPQHYWMPIPIKEVNANSKIKQNPNY